MQFVVIGRDGTDDKALDRRLAAREAHLAYGEKFQQQGKLLYATAILDGHDKMVGSIMILELDSRNELDSWLANEPYMLGDVWRDLEINKCRVGPTFVPAAKK